MLREMGKIIIRLREVEGRGKKEEALKIIWCDSRKKSQAFSLQDQSRVVNSGTFWELLGFWGYVCHKLETT